ncbi:hypothetical protein ACSLPA_01090, partial [Escherichia coli]
KQPLAEEYDIYWYAGEDDASKSYACLTPELVAQFGLKEDVAKTMAATTVNLFIDSGLLQECQQEHQQVTDTQPYHCPIPKNVTPSPLK